MKLKTDNKILSCVSVATMITLMANFISPSANAQDFYVQKSYPTTDTNLFNNCGKICPEVEYHFIDTGHAWLDAIVNKDITTGIAILTDSTDKTEEKKWQAFANNPMPSNSQYTERLNAAISRLVAENKSMVKQRGKDFDNTIPPVQVIATPMYLGHKESQKDKLELFSTEF